ncbi:VOC family protein [Nocardiopsis sp. CNT-189]|uniref:VOC family protein n=1 Tax=Nocardiopsis oceanisediminis TaxID=2816862 RepID=UPI003B392824
MPQVTGIAHITLSVRDIRESLDFYRTVLGFKAVRTKDGKRILTTECRSACGMVLFLTQHEDHFNSLFDPRHAGADHIAFQAASVAELELWEERLTELDVDHAPIVHGPDGSVLAFSDPDGIQLELFAPAEIGDDGD